jgi:hypothetical protein
MSQSHKPQLRLGLCVGQGQFRAFPSLQKALLESYAHLSRWHQRQEECGGGVFGK